MKVTPGLSATLLLACSLSASEPVRVVAWVASSHGPYPSGNAVAQPDLQNVLPAGGAQDQTFRLIVKPDIFGPGARLRFSNVFGTRPVTLDGAYVGLHASAGSLVPGTNAPVRFNSGKQSVTVEPGATVWSDTVNLSFSGQNLSGRKLAVSFHVAGRSGPITWHAKSMTTSYLTAPGSGSHGREEDNQAFPFTTTSWYFLDAIEVLGPCGVQGVVAFGDSITETTAGPTFSRSASTQNMERRWPW